MYAVFLVGVAVGAFAVWLYYLVEGKKVARQIEAYAEAIREQLDNKLIPATIEIAENRLFLYNKETNAYIADAATFEELNKKASELFPGMYFDVDQTEIDRASEFNPTNPKNQ